MSADDDDVRVCIHDIAIGHCVTCEEAFSMGGPAHDDDDDRQVVRHRRRSRARRHVISIWQRLTQLLLDACCAVNNRQARRAWRLVLLDALVRRRAQLELVALLKSRAQLPACSGCGRVLTVCDREVRLCLRLFGGTDRAWNDPAERLTELCVQGARDRLLASIGVQCDEGGSLRASSRRPEKTGVQ